MTERTPADVTAAIAPCTARAMVAAGIEPGPIKRRKPSCVAIGARGLLSRLHYWMESANIGKTGGGLVMRGASIGKTRCAGGNFCALCGASCMDARGWHLPVERHGLSRVYLKTPNAPGQRVFSRCAAPFFLEIRQYSCGKMSCAT